MFEWSERMFGRYAISNTKAYRVHKLIMSDSKSIFNYPDNQKPNRFLIFFSKFHSNYLVTTINEKSEQLLGNTRKKKDKGILIF